MRQLTNGESPNDDEVVVALTKGELSVLANGINEAREAIEDWEFDTRVGVSTDDADALRSQLVAILRGS